MALSACGRSEVCEVIFKAYRNLRANSQQSIVRCAKFQLWIWYLDAKNWPANYWHRRFMRRWAKRDPDGLSRAIDQIKKLTGVK